MPKVLMSLPTKLNLLADLYNCNRCGDLFIDYFIKKASFIPLKKKKKKNLSSTELLYLQCLGGIFISSKWRWYWPIKWVISVIFKAILEITQLYVLLLLLLLSYEQCNKAYFCHMVLRFFFFIFSFWSPMNKMTNLNNILISFPGPSDLISSVIACSVFLLSDFLLWQYCLQPKEGSTWF